MSKMADFIQKENHDDYVQSIEGENKRLKEKVSTLEKTLSYIKTVLVASGAHDGQTLNACNASMNGCQSAESLVVTDSSTRQRDQEYEAGTDHTHYPRTFPEEETTVSSESKCGPLKFKTLSRSWSDMKKEELKNAQDEHRLRHFLCKAITAHASLLASEGFGLQASDFPDRLVSRGCITEEECSKFLNSSNRPINLMRVILGLVIRRDCYTLLSFIDILFQYNEYVAKEIAQTCDNTVSEKDDSYRMQGLDCSHCLLRERIEPVLIVDRLIGRNYHQWLPFYEQVTRWDNEPEKRASLWYTLMTQVSKDGCLAEILFVTIEALEACGFHSDIVKSLQDDQCTGVNSFICRHKSTGEGQKCGNDLETARISEPKMHEIKLDDIEDDDTTRLKEVFRPMIQNVSNENTETNMQELKLCEAELQAGVMPSFGHTGGEQTNNGTRNDDANSSRTILFVTNSNIIISKREDT